MKTFCVYRIFCYCTLKSYVGATCQGKKRCHRHFSDLKRGIHASLRLQNAYDKYGKHNFEFEILEDGISDDEISSREQYWMDVHWAFKNGYNSRKEAVRIPSSEEIAIWRKLRPPRGGARRCKAIVSYDIQTKKIEKFESVWAARSLPFHKGLPSTLSGKTITCAGKLWFYEDEFNEYNLEVKLSKFLSIPEGCRRFYLKPKTLRLIENTIIRNDGKMYKNGLEAARDLGVNKDAVCAMLRGERENVAGYTFKFLGN